MLRNSKRIESIINLVPSHTDVLWDLCCDHGNIGLGAFKLHQHINVNFVDQVQTIIDSLNLKLNLVDSNKLHAMCNSATCVDYKNELNNTFLVAGVGGDLTIKIMKQILKTNNTHKNTFLISPHNNINLVREYIVSSGLKLSVEILVKDNNKFYEMIALNHTSQKNPTLFGSEMWEYLSDDHLLYIQNEMKHLEKKIEFSKDKKHIEKYEFLKKTAKQ